MVVVIRERFTCFCFCFFFSPWQYIKVWYVAKWAIISVESGRTKSQSGPSHGIPKDLTYKEDYSCPSTFLYPLLVKLTFQSSHSCHVSCCVNQSLCIYLCKFCFCATRGLKHRPFGSVDQCWSSFCTCAFWLQSELILGDKKRWKN